MRQCGSVNWYKFGQWVVLVSLLFVVSTARAQNLPPVPDLGIPNQHARVGEAFSYAIPSTAFRDENTGTSLTYNVSGLPAGLTFSGNTISGTPTTEQTSAVTVRASDGALSSTISFKIYVHAATGYYAAFTPSTQRGCGTQYVRFSNKSAIDAGVTYNWDFGNGNTSKMPEPAAIYTSPGKYTVTLSFVYNGVTYSFSDDVTIYSLPSPSLTSLSAGDCEPFNATLNGTAQNAVYYEWFSNQFTGQQQYFSTGNSIIIPGLENGNYTVDLTVTDNNGCKGTVKVDNLFTVYDKPVSAFTFVKDNACEPSATTFTPSTQLSGSTLQTVVWNVDGQTYTNPEEPFVYNFTTKGDHIVSLQTTSDKGCTSDLSVDTVRFNNNNSASFTVTPSQGCLGTVFSFDDNVSSTIVSRSWDFDGDGLTDATSEDPQWEYTQPGDYTATLTATFNDGCVMEVTKSIKVEDMVASFEAEYTGDCSRNMSLTLTDKSSSEFVISSWKWYYRSISSGWIVLSTQQNPPTLTGLTPGNYDVSLVVKNAVCSDSINKTITITESKVSGIDVSGASYGCIPAGETFFVANFVSAYDTPEEFSWDFDNSGTYDQVTPSNTVSYIYPASGSYSVKVQVRTTQGCYYYYTLSNAVHLADKPTVDNVILHQADLCYSTGIELEVAYPASVDSLRFYTPEGVVYETNPGAPNYWFTHHFSSIGTKSIGVVAIDNGCPSDVYTVSNIQINGPKSLFSTTSSSFCNVSEVQFTNGTSNNPGATTNYEWDFGDGGPASTTTNPLHTYSPGTYYVTLTATDATSGCTDSFTDTISLFSFTETTDIIHPEYSSGCAPLEDDKFSLVNLDVSSNFEVDSVVWNFKDGTTVTKTDLSEVYHTFTSPGSYKVSVLIYGAGGACTFSSELDNPVRVKGPIIDNIGYSPDPVCSGAEVTFNANLHYLPGDDGSPDNYLWDFGDGQTVPVGSPGIATHTYANDSTYTVTLKVTDSNNCSSTLSKKDLITIHSFTADFTADQSLCNSTIVSFHNKSTGSGLTYTWNFGDGTGNQVKTETEFTHQYASEGSYTAVLTVTAPGGCDLSTTQTIHVVNITAEFSAVKTDIGCAPSVATFIPVTSGSSVLGYVWNYGDSTPASTELTHKYYTPGVFTVSLQVIFDNGCKVPAVKENYIKVSGAYAKLAYDNTPGCSPHAVAFELTEMSDVDSITWDFGDGNPYYAYSVPAMTEHDTTYSYTNPGNARPSVILTDEVCGSYTYEKFGASSDLEKEIYTSVPPDGAMDISSRGICQGVPITFVDRSVPADKDTVPVTQWLWKFDDGSTSNKDSVQHAYPNWGNYYPQLIVSNRMGCTDTVETSTYIKIYSVDSIRAFIDSPSNDPYLACPGVPIDFEGSASSYNGPITSYKWDFGDSLTASTQNASHTYNKELRGESLQLLLVATDDKQCSDSTFRTVDINNLQAAFGYDPQPVYRGDAVDFTDESTVETGHTINLYDWRFTGGSIASSSSKNPLDVVYNTIDTIGYPVTLTVTDNTGCSDQVTDTIPVLNNRPVVSDFTVQFFEGIHYFFVPDSFAVNYSDKDNQALVEISITSLPDSGKLYFDGSEVTGPIVIPYSQISLLEYRPDSEWTGNTSFSWNGSDGRGYALNDATVYIVVLEEPEPPLPQSFIIEVAENEVANISYADLFAKILNPTFPGFTLDSIQIVSLPVSQRSKLYFNGTPVVAPAYYSSVDIGSNLFTVELPFGYNEGSVSFLWNGFDGINWGTTPAIITIVYKNKPPTLLDIIRDNLPEDAAQSVKKSEFDSKYSDEDAPHDQPQRVFLVVPSGVQGTFKLNKTTYGVGTHSILYSSFDSIHYIPPGGFNGSVDFQWGASDGQDTTWANIRFVYVNTPPVAKDIYVHGFEDTNYSFRTDTFALRVPSGAFYDIDKNDNLGSIRIETLPQHGVLTFKPSTTADTLTVGDLPFGIVASQINYKLVYVPDLNWSGNDSFTYSSYDGTNWSASSATVYITIAPVNDPPVAVNDTVSTLEDTPFSGYNVIDNDYDVDDLKENLTVSVADQGTAGANGTIELTTDGILSYSPNLNVNGTVSFTYNLCDPSGDCTTATVFIDITPVNDPPMAVNDTITIWENEPGYVSNANTNVLKNDIDPEGNDKVVVQTDGEVPGTTLNGNYGTIVIYSDGSFSYSLIPDNVLSLGKGDIVEDAFSYIAADRPDSLTSGATLVIRIKGLNSPPVVANDTVYVDEDAIINYYDEDALLTNATDPEGDDLTVTAIDSSPTSPATSNNSDQFNWRADGLYSYMQNGSFNSLPEGGTAEVVFPYTVSDGYLDADANLFIIIKGVNDPPIAQDDFLEYDINKDSMYVKNNQNGSFLFNDFDPDDNYTLTIISVNGDNAGLATGSVGILKWPDNWSGAYTYIPDADSIIKLTERDTATDVFTYIITDEHGATDTATLTITIKGKNDNPLSNDDVLEIWEDTLANSVSAPGLLDNDSDPENDPIVVAIDDQTSGTIQGKYGYLAWDSTGAYTYYSDPDKVNPFPQDSVYLDKFHYRMKDNSGADSHSDLYVKISGQNDAPIAVDNLEYITEEDTLRRAVAGSTGNGLLKNDSDIDWYDAITVTTVDGEITQPTDGEFGLLEWNPDGTFTYTLHAAMDSLRRGEIVVDTFQYVIEDLHDSTATANLIIQITGVNDKPVAQNDTIWVLEDSLTVDYLQDSESLRYNDFDVDGDTTWIYTVDNRTSKLVSLPHCSIVWDSTGTFTYYRNDGLDTLAIGTEVIDSVQYRLFDTNDAYANAWLFIHILGENDAPVAVRDNNSLLETTDSIFSNALTNLLANDSDIDNNDSISVLMVARNASSVTIGKYGELWWNPDGSYTYYNNTQATDSLKDGVVVYDIFPYTIVDLEMATDTDTLWIKITGVNDGPIAYNDTLSLMESDVTKSLVDGVDGLLDNDIDVDNDQLSIVNFDNANQNTYNTTYGAITWDQHGSITFVPDFDAVDSLRHGERVTEWFTYVVSDGITTDTAQLVITITGENDNPVALTDSVFINEDTLVVYGTVVDRTNLLVNDYDVDGDPIFISAINELPSDSIVRGNYGELHWDSLGQYTYYTYPEITDTLAYGETVYDAFGYLLSDTLGGTALGSLVIQIDGVNDPPVAVENRYYTRDRIPITVAPPDTTNILYNDYDVDSDEKTVIEVNESDANMSNGHYGVLNWKDDGSFVYSPDSAFAVSLRPLETVVDTFMYKMEDDWQAADTSLLHFTIEGINNPPRARKDTLYVSEDDLYKSLPAPGLLIEKNVDDPDRDTLAVLSITGPVVTSVLDSVPGNYGYIKWDSLGNVTYFPNQDVIHQLGYGEFITEAFTYTVVDEGDLTASAKLIVHVLGQNDPIVAYNDTASVDEDTWLRYNVCENDSDIDFDWEGNFDYSSLTIITPPQHGSASRNSVTGEIYYNPDKDFYGEDSLQYRICDTGDPVYCDEAWFYIHVLPVNDPPVATHLVLKTPMNTPVSFDYPAQVSDIDDGIDSSSLIVFHDGKAEITVDEANYQITYSPIADSSYRYEFIYSMTDKSAVPAYVIVTVLVGDTLSDFQAQNDTITTLEDTAVDIYVLANDTIGAEFPDPRSVEIEVFPVNGVAVFDPVKQIVVYTPDENFNGKDSLAYIVASGLGHWDFAWVYITVSPVDDGFMAKDDYAETDVDKAISIAVLANDVDPDNRVDEVSVATLPPNGTVIANADQTIAYTPAAGFVGIDSFYYRICDTETSECDSAWVIVIVSPEEKLFEAMNDNYSTDENTVLVMDNPLPTSNDKNTDVTVLVDPGTFDLISGPEKGSTTTTNNIITYTPEPNYNGPDWMQYIVADEDRNWDMAEINVWVNKVNTSPVAVNDTAIVTKNDFKRIFVLENDYDIDGSLDWSTLAIVGNPQNGEVIVETKTGTILYKPSINSGDDHFTYQICDTEGQCAQATVYVTIELETTIYIYRTTPEDTPLTIDIAAEMAKYNLTFAISEVIEEVTPDLGSYVWSNNNQLLTYSPDIDLNGKDTIQLNVWSGDHSEFAYLRIFITILPVNDAPVAVPDTLHWVNAPDTLTMPYDSILINDYDVDGDTIHLSRRLVDVGFDGLSVTIHADSTITIASDSIEWCNAWFIYEISDGILTDTAIVWLWPPLYGITAYDDKDTVDENSLSNRIDVLANDAIVDNQRCTIDSVIVITPPVHGTAAGTADNFVDYAPIRHYYGPDSLEYRIVDRWGQESTAWVFIEVLQKNSPPVAVPDDTLAAFGDVIYIPVLNNDYDPDAVDLPGSPGDPNAYVDSARTYLVISSGPMYGTVVFDPVTYNFIYTPDVKSCKPDYFEYTIFDNEGDSATAMVTIQNPEEAPLYAVSDTVKVYPGIPVDDVDPLLNDSGFFNEELTEFVETYPLHGSVSWTADNIVSYTPDKDFIGHDSLYYTIYSPCGNSQSAWIVFEVDELRVPEIISPNGDGKNDVLIIDGIEYFPDSWLQIYNRYGHIVYEKKRYDNSWGGYSNKGSLGGNKPLPAGTYYYTLTYNEGRNKQAGFIYIFW